MPWRHGRTIVHISVTNAAADSALPYYRGKAQQEQALMASGIAVACGRQTNAMVLDAVGPETCSFEAFVRLIAGAVRPSVSLVHVPPAIGIALGRTLGLVLRDVLLTRAELQGLMEGLLTSPQAPNGTPRFTDWLFQHKDTLGVQYASELGRHFRWRPA